VVKQEGNMGRVCSIQGRNKKMHVLVTKVEGGTQLGKSWHKWEENIKTGVTVMGWEVVE
jgi:hypothetical protein